MRPYIIVLMELRSQDLFGKGIQLLTSNLRNWLFVFLMAAIGLPLQAEENEISEALNAALKDIEPEISRLSIELEDCQLDRFIVNVNYCAQTKHGFGDRSIHTLVALSEVEKISATSVNDDYLVTFHFDITKTNRLTSIFERFTMDHDTAFERFQERRQAALNNAQLASRSTISDCSGSEPFLEKSERLSIVFDNQPKEFDSFIRYVRNCRAPMSLEVQEW